MAKGPQKSGATRAKGERQHGDRNYMYMALVVGVLTAVFGLIYKLDRKAMSHWFHTRGGQDASRLAGCIFLCLVIMLWLFRDSLVFLRPRNWKWHKLGERLPAYVVQRYPWLQNFEVELEKKLASLRYRFTVEVARGNTAESSRVGMKLGRCVDSCGGVSFEVAGITPGGLIEKRNNAKATASSSGTQVKKGDHLEKVNSKTSAQDIMEEIGNTEVKGLELHFSRSVQQGVHYTSWEVELERLRPDDMLAMELNFLSDFNVLSVEKVYPGGLVSRWNKKVAAQKGGKKDQVICEGDWILAVAPHLDMHIFLPAIRGSMKSRLTLLRWNHVPKAKAVTSTVATEEAAAAISLATAQSNVAEASPAAAVSKAVEASPSPSPASSTSLAAAAEEAVKTAKSQPAAGKKQKEKPAQTPTPNATPTPKAAAVPSASGHAKTNKSSRTTPLAPQQAEEIAPLDQAKEVPQAEEIAIPDPVEEAPQAEEIATPDAAEEAPQVEEIAPLAPAEEARARAPTPKASAEATWEPQSKGQAEALTKVQAALASMRGDKKHRPSVDSSNSTATPAADGEGAAAVVAKEAPSNDKVIPEAVGEAKDSNKALSKLQSEKTMLNEQPKQPIPTQFHGSIAAAKAKAEDKIRNAQDGHKKAEEDKSRQGAPPSLESIYMSGKSQAAEKKEPSNSDEKRGHNVVKLLAEAAQDRVELTEAKGKVKDLQEQVWLMQQRLDSAHAEKVAMKSTITNMQSQLDAAADLAEQQAVQRQPTPPPPLEPPPPPGLLPPANSAIGAPPGLSLLSSFRPPPGLMLVDDEWEC